MDAAISIHALREEGDCRSDRGVIHRSNFYPRPPRGGRPRRIPRWLCGRDISIHALREEGDRPCRRSAAGICDFYPRPPRGGRLEQLFGGSNFRKFLSTPSARRATRSEAPAEVAGAFLSTPSARRATFDRRADGMVVGISIHALREEGDWIPEAAYGPKENFYPRPPRGGRRLRILWRLAITYISIHALREEGDASSSSSSMTMTNFYPRPPRGGRHTGLEHWCSGPVISIHALREEGDNREISGRHCGQLFLSTPSARRATFRRLHQRSG